MFALFTPYKSKLLPNLSCCPVITFYTGCMHSPQYQFAHLLVTSSTTPNNSLYKVTQLAPKPIFLPPITSLVIFCLHKGAAFTFHAVQ